MVFTKNIISLCITSLLICSLNGQSFLGNSFLFAEDVQEIEDYYDEHVLPQEISKISEEITLNANNSCIGGKQGLSTKEQLLEFIQGPCSPFVIVPGLLLSKLTVSIDCEVLKAENHEIFSSCGWQDCLGGLFSPKKEYKLWIANFLGPMDPVVATTSVCWGNLIQVIYNASAPTILDQFISPKGVNVSVLGANEATKDQSNCGFEATTNLLPSPVQTRSTKGWKRFLDSLTELGYQVGLTLYASPYDWRKTTLANQVGTLVDNTLKQIYNLTGKPSVLISHSLGNACTLRAMNQLTAEEKDKYVANWIQLFPDIAGASPTYPYLVGGDPQFHVNRIIEMNPKAMIQVFRTTLSFIDLFPKDTMTRFVNQPWLQEWAQRQGLEDQYDVNTPEGKAFWEQAVKNGNYTLKYYPTPLEQCTHGFKLRPDHCELASYNWSEVNAIYVQDGANNLSFTSSYEDALEVITKYSGMMPDFAEFWNISLQSNDYLLKNPEVPVTLIFGSHLNTQIGGVWDYVPKTKIDKQEYAAPNFDVNKLGDGSVTAAMQLIPGFKWAWEYDNNAHEDAHPVKFVQYCATYNQRGTIYDEMDPSKPYVLNKNEYIGLDCDCMKKEDAEPTDGAECSHGQGPDDSKILEFAINVMFGNYRNEAYNNTGAYILNESNIEKISHICPALNLGDTTYWDLVNGSNSVDVDDDSMDEYFIRK